MRFLMSKDCWAYCPLLESCFKGTPLCFHLNTPISWNIMQCAQVSESSSDLESIFMQWTGWFFCPEVHGDLGGFGSAGWWTAKAQLKSFSHVEDPGVSVGNGRCRTDQVRLHLGLVCVPTAPPAPPAPGAGPSLCICESSQLQLWLPLGIVIFSQIVLSSLCWCVYGNYQSSKTLLSKKTQKVSGGWEKEAFMSDILCIAVPANWAIHPVWTQVSSCNLDANPPVSRPTTEGCLSLHAETPSTLVQVSFSHWSHLPLVSLLLSTVYQQR